MPKNIYRKFATVYPSYHWRSGQPTYFVEKIMRQLGVDVMSADYRNRVVALNKHIIPLVNEFLDSLVDLNRFLEDGEMLKKHTIRSGAHFTEGDMLVPSVWSDKPYNSKSIQFWYPLEIKNVQDVYRDMFGNFFSPTKHNLLDVSILSKNDGLSTVDFKDWFVESFNGQIICWDENTKY